MRTKSPTRCVLDPLPENVGRVLVAMSGGVDSSAAAALLRERGVDLVGVTLHLWDAEGADKVGRCCAPEDRDDARRSCEQLGIPHYVLDERAAFRAHVVDPFVAEYERGRTPIPCVHCNRTVKLTMLARVADELGCTHIATGHYARIARDPSGVRLLRGVDATKDQSYFLFGLPKPVLERMIFPLGDRTKESTRLEAERLGLCNAKKPDSQELCFVPDGNVGEFISRHGGTDTAGRIVDESGATLAPHGGLGDFTVGKRRGLALGGGTEPRYVLRIVPDTHDVVVGGANALLSNEARASAATWIGAPGEGPFEAEVQIRYRHRAAKATITREGDSFVARFHEPQRALTPGQAAVVYSGNEVLGGGFLEA